MSNNFQPSLTQQIEELNDLYYKASHAHYEIILQRAVMQLAQILPGFTIAYAEIASEGGERIQHGEMCYVLMPIEYGLTEESKE